ncbi:MAG TPA: RNase adapter RapZ [Rhodanobacteraceae bacterium]|nr:RNase adapter RapZ [Rhodanobacteraceae bacterium]
MSGGTPITRVLVLTGMSGGGKTVALRALEDLEFYCVDNLPAALIPSLVRAVTDDNERPQQRIAVGVDIRNRMDDLQRMPEVLSKLAADSVEVQLIFLDSRDEVLIKRYSESRRRHPLSAGGLSLSDAIARERKLLRPLASIAERQIDTSDLNVHQLRRTIATDVARGSNEMTLLFESFAYRRGLPLDADFVFDARCLPNPHWDPALRPLSGRDLLVKRFLDQQPLVQRFADGVTAFLREWLPRFEHEDRSYVTICIGCTGGRHRSVYLAELLCERLHGSRRQVLTFHRELE